SPMVLVQAEPVRLWSGFGGVKTRLPWSVWRTTVLMRGLQPMVVRSAVRAMAREVYRRQVALIFIICLCNSRLCGEFSNCQVKKLQRSNRRKPRERRSETANERESTLIAGVCKAPVGAPYL